MEIKASRIQSPSSINTYKQCPRRYYYTYIEKIPTKPNIHTVRGTIVHSVLEEFFDLDFSADVMNFGDFLLIKSLELFDKHWNLSKDKLSSLEISDSEIQFYYDDSKTMILNWVSHFLSRVKDCPDGNFLDTFNKLKPVSREEKFISEEFSVMGYIDAIEVFDGKTRIIDYKTSKADKLSDEYMLQLGIYALLYNEKKGSYPDEVGLFLLKHGERMVKVTEELVKNAKFEIENIHMSTQTRNKSDYPMKQGPLCNYCDFYNLCFGSKKNDLNNWLN